MSNFEDQNNNNNSRPPPLQPSALTRSDNEGMYVAVGPSAFNRSSSSNNNSQQQPPQSFSRNNTSHQSPYGRNNNFNQNDNNVRNMSHYQDYYTPGGAPSRPNTTNNNTNSNNNNIDDFDGPQYHSQPYDNTGVRDAKDPYARNKIDYDVSANESRFRHYRTMMRDEDKNDNNDEHDGRGRSQSSAASSARGGTANHHHRNFIPYTTGRVRYGKKQHWLSGYTVSDWCSNSPSCLDGILCLWCMHGMQWRRIHAKPRSEGGGRFEVFYGIDEEEGDREMEARYNDGGRGGGGGSRSKRSKMNHDDRGLNDDDDEGEENNNDDDDNLPEGERQLRDAQTENLIDKCRRIDWGCCLITFFGDLITCPITLAPLGSAAAQYQIRKELRIRYNLVDAPGSPSPDELEQMENERLEKENKRRMELFQQQERASFESKNFQRAPPTPGRMMNDSYDYKFSESETNPHQVTDSNQQQQVPSSSKQTKASNKNTNKNSRNEKQQQKEESSSMCSDELREYLISWCCAPCSTAQVQREMTMRGEWPGGYWTKPMRVRADLAPGRGVQEALRAFASLSPQRQHRTIDNSQPSLNTPRHLQKQKYPSMMNEAPPSRAGPQQPPPTPNEKRYQGSGISEHEQQQIMVRSPNYTTTSNNNSNNNNQHHRLSNHNNNNNNNPTTTNSLSSPTTGGGGGVSDERRVKSPPIRTPSSNLQNNIIDHNSNNNSRRSGSNNNNNSRNSRGEEEYVEQQRPHVQQGGEEENENNDHHHDEHHRRSYSPDSPMKPTPGLGFKNR